MRRILPLLAFAGVLGLAAGWAIRPRAGVVVALVVAIALVPLLTRADDRE